MTLSLAPITWAEVVGLANALAWPLLVGVLAFAFRSQLRDFSKRLTRVSLAGQEFIARTVEGSDTLLRSIPLAASHPEAVPRSTEREVSQLAATDPRGAILLLRRLVDRRVRLISASGNWLEDFERLGSERWRKMHWVAQQMDWDADTQASVMVHAIIEDAALDNEDVSETVLLRLVDQGLTILGLVQSFEFERHLVINSGLQVYADQGLTQQQDGRFAVLLKSISADGQEHTRAFITGQPHYYKPGMSVGYEWRENPPAEEGDRGYVAVDGEATEVIRWDFRGRDLSDFE